MLKKIQPVILQYIQTDKTTNYLNRRSKLEGAAGVMNSWLGLLIGEPSSSWFLYIHLSTNYIREEINLPLHPPVIG